jgi:hypothetical protein
MKLKIRAADFVLIFALLVIGCVPFFFYTAHASGSQVVISVSGQEYGVYSLQEDQIIPLEDIGEVVIESGSVFIRNSSCPDHLCEQMGKISTVGNSIVCLPNRLLIQITGEGGVDAVTR